MSITQHVRQPEEHKFYSVADGSYDRYGKGGRGDREPVIEPAKWLYVERETWDKAREYPCFLCTPRHLIYQRLTIVTATTTKTTRPSLPREPTVLPPTLCAAHRASVLRLSLALLFHDASTPETLIDCAPQLFTSAPNFSVAGHGVSRHAKQLQSSRLNTKNTRTTKT